MDKQNEQAKNFKLVFEENVIDYDLTISKCTVCNYDFSYIGIINNRGTIKFNDNVKFWDIRGNKKCEKCSDFPICFGISCPLKLKFNKSNCFNYKNHEKELVQIINEQKKYNMTIGGKYV